MQGKNLQYGYITETTFDIKNILTEEKLSKYIEQNMVLINEKQLKRLKNNLKG
jgi:ethanolamine utilization cobalamin adenosyltransferase